MIRTNFIDVFIEPVFAKSDSSDIAFCIKDKFYTYKQLYDVVEQIYSLVVGLPEDLIGLYATDDIRTYASIIALWACGKTYIPLNPNQPKERHAEVIRSINTHYVLSSVTNYDINVDRVDVISSENVMTAGYKRTGQLRFKEVDDSTLAYIIFTSGSTGKPKGVQLTRGNVAAFIDSMNHIGLDITSEDKCLQPFDLTFDFSVSGYVIPLVKGASIYTVPQKAIKVSYIAGLLEDYQLTVLQMVPSMVRNMLPYMDEIELGCVRYNILCGEALTGTAIRNWHDANPKMVSYNMYGPTENTVFCTTYVINEDNIDNLLLSNDVVCIGRTFRNSDLLLLDDDDSVITEENSEGELCLCGSQLSPGYWKNDTENAAKFLDINGKRYYRTGDICYYNENLMFVGRKDFQVKINGFRVELGEIENRYAKISKGLFSVVLPYKNDQGNTELAIVIEGKEYDTKEHKSQLANELPAYEVPSRWLFVRSMPLNSNGKIDRKAIAKHFAL